MSKKERRSVPVLRFKGFTDDWEQRKFTELGKLYYGKSAPKWSVVEKGGTPCIRYGELYTKYSSKIDNVYSHTSIDKSKLKFSTGNELLIPRVGEEPLDFAKHTSWLSIPNVAIGEMITVLKTKENPLFLANYLRAKYVFKFARLVEGGNVSNLYFERYEDTNILIPSKNEQQNISKLILKIDKLITLQQRKLDRLLLLKKAYLTNLLPDKTQNPKVRFKEFNDKWKKLKLGNISSISAGGDVNKQKLLKKGRYPVIANALTNKGVIGYYESEYRIQAPAVTVTGRGDIGHAYARKTNFTPVVRLLSVKSKHNVDFLAEAINQKKVPFESTGVPQLTVPKLSNYKILFPSSITEENKIGNFIIKFDEIINLQNKKISSLEQVKNFLLQNMFI